MTTDLDDWHQVLARVTGKFARGEHRIATSELFTKHLGVPMTDRACRRLKRVMRALGWRGPKPMRWGGKTMHCYWRPTVGLPAMSAPAQTEVQNEPAAEIATLGDGTLAPELEKVTVLGLRKLEQILRIPTDRGDGNLLRAQVTAAGTAIHAQLRADETRLRAKVQSDTLERLLKAIEKEKARQRGEAVRELPRLDVSHDGEAAESEAGPP
jgi:hypothetical protein